MEDDQMFDAIEWPRGLPDEVFWEGLGSAIISGFVAAGVALLVVWLDRRHARRMARATRAETHVLNVLAALDSLSEFKWAKNTAADVSERRQALNRIATKVIAARASLATVSPDMRDLVQVRWRQLTICQFFAKQVSPESAQPVGEEFNRCHEEFGRDIEKWLEDGSVRSQLPVPIRRQLTGFVSEFVIMGPEPLHGNGDFGWIDILPGDPPRGLRGVGRRAWRRIRRRPLRSFDHISPEKLAATRAANQPRLRDGPRSSNTSLPEELRESNTSHQ